jgi:hypothetical protein
VNCLFLEVASGRGHVVPVRVRVRAADEGHVTGLTPCDDVMQAAAKRAARDAFAVLRGLGFDAALPERHAVEWWIDGPELRYEGPSLGLGVALATVAAYTGARIDPRLAVTGSVSAGKVVPVAGVGHKWGALRDKERFRALVLPAANVADLPEEARGHPSLGTLEVSTVGEAVLDVLGPALGLAAGRLSELGRPDGEGDGVAIQLWVQPAGQRAQRNVEPPPDGGARTWYVGDRLRVCAVVSRGCHLTLVSVGAAGDVRVLLPNSFEAETAVRAGQLVTFPGPGAGFDLELLGPPGRERVIALTSARPLRLTPQDFGPASPAGGARPRTRGIGVIARDWRDDVLGRQEIEFYVSDRQEAAGAVRTRGARAPSWAPAAIEDGFTAIDLG